MAKKNDSKKTPKTTADSLKGAAMVVASSPLLTANKTELIVSEGSPLAGFSSPAEFYAAQAAVDPSKVIGVIIEEQQAELEQYRAPLQERIKELNDRLLQIDMQFKTELREASVMHFTEEVQQFRLPYVSCFDTFLYNIQFHTLENDKALGLVIVAKLEVGAVESEYRYGSGPSFENTIEWTAQFNRMSEKNLQWFARVPIANFPGLVKLHAEKQELDEKIRANQAQLAKLNFDISDIPKRAKKLENQMVRGLLAQTDTGSNLLDKLRVGKIDSKQYGVK